MKPKVAIVLPVLNSMPHLEPMIKSLYNSTNFPFELIIIDGFSTDGTIKYIQDVWMKKGNIRIFQIPKKGLTNAINYGIDQAGELDIYITQDDVIHFKLYGRDWLLEMYDLASKKHIGIVTSLGGQGVSDETYIKGLRWAGTWNTYIPRSTIKKVGKFDEKMGPGDDIDYCYRVGKAGLQGGLIDYWVQHHRLTEHGDADSELKQKKMAKYFRKKWGLK